MISKKKFSPLEKCIIHLTAKLEGGLTRTKLIKLLFLADLHYFKKHQSSITGVRYRSYFYGPYSEEIMKAVNRLNGFEIEEYSGSSSEGRGYYIYTLGKNPRNLKINLRPEEKKTLDFVIKDFGDIPLPKLLEYVYSTEAFRECRKGGLIDLN